MRHPGMPGFPWRGGALGAGCADWGAGWPGGGAVTPFGGCLRRGVGFGRTGCDEDGASPGAVRVARVVGALSAGGMSDPIETWTDRLRDTAPGLEENRARSFVHDLYTAAQNDLGEEEAEADFEREE